VVLRDRLRLAADTGDRPQAAFHDVADEPLRRLPPGALPSRCHPTFAQERAGSIEVSPGLLESALAVHHPRAGGVAELLDERCPDRRAHSDSPPSAPAACSSSASDAGASSIVGPSSAVSSARAGSLAGAAVFSDDVPFEPPAATPSATTLVTRSQER